MKIASILGILLCTVMGFIIYLSYSLNSIIQVENNLDQTISYDQKKEEKNIFNLPKDKLKKKLEQLNELKKIKKDSLASRLPAQITEPDKGPANERDKSLQEYRESVGMALSIHYEELIQYPQGMSFEEVEGKRLKILTYKRENGIEPEFIESIPLDQVLSVQIQEKDIYEMSSDDIFAVREQFTYEEIMTYFNSLNNH